ncbi:MAG: DUF6691 family protein [Desulfobacteraceae bacterium]
MRILWYGLVTGILFGILLQKSRVLRYDKQIGALRLLDLTIVKFMLSTVMVAMAGVYLLRDLGMAHLAVKPTLVGANILGGLIFGVGWGLLGYCPGTAIGALGEGRWDALWGILGMLTGAALFAELYPFLQNTLLTWGNYGRLTLPQVLGVNHWVIIVAFILGGLWLCRWFEQHGL